MIFFVGLVNFAGMEIPLHFPGIIADKAVDFLSIPPNFPAWLILIAKFFLRPDFVFLGTPLMPVGNRRQSVRT